MGALYDTIKKRVGTAPKGSLYERVRLSKSAVAPVPGAFGSIPSPYSGQVRTSTQMIPDETTPNIPRAIGHFGKEVGQGIMRNIASLVGSEALAPAVEPITKKIAGIEKSNPTFKAFTEDLARRLYGDVSSPQVTELTGETRGEQIKPVGERTVAFEKKLEEKKKEYDELLKTPNLSTREKLVLNALSYLIGNHKGQLAPLIIGGYAGLDATPIGGGAKKAAKIPKQLEGLAAEAGKYKSAEEFVEAQDEIVKENLTTIRESGYGHIINDDGTLTVFHKTTPLAASNIERTGFSADSFFADSSEAAQALASTNKKGGVKIMEIKVDPKDVSFSPSTYELSSSEKLVKGRDGVYRAKGNLPKSQLTDLWNKVHGEKKLSVPAGLPEVKPTVGKQAEELSTKAGAYQPEFAKNIEDIGAKLGLKSEVGPPKGAERITEKTTVEKGGDISQIGDANRGVIFVENLDDVGPTLSKVVSAARSKFGKVERVQLTIGTPSYNKVIVNVRTPAGLGEIQITTPDLWKVKQGEGDVLYKIARSANTPEELAEHLGKRMEELYQMTPQGAIAKATKGISEGGATIDVVRNIDFAGTPHIAVSPFPERSTIFQGATTPKMIADYLEKNFDLLSQKGYALGGWFDTSSKQTYLDVVVPVSKKRSSDAVALGRMSNQKAIFDLEDFKEISTGGTGEVKGAASLAERQKVVDDLLSGEPPKRPPSVEKVLGKEPSPKVTRTEEQLLKSKLKEQGKGAKAGFKAGKAAARVEIIGKLRASTDDIDSTRKEVVEYVKDNLDPGDRGKALVLVRDAKNQRDLTKAFARVNRWAEEAEKKEIKSEVLDLQKKIMDSPSISIDYKARVKELMGDFELKGHRKDTLERLKATQEFLEAEAKKGNDIEMPRRVLKALGVLNRVPLEEITINQMLGLKAEMELLEQLGRTKFKTIENIWDIQKTKIFEEVEAQKAKPIENTELIRPEIGERLTLTQKFRNLIWTAGNGFSRIDKVIAPMDTVFDLLDGGKGTYAGANFRFFKGQVDAGYGKYISRKNALQNPVVELATKYKLDDANFERMGVVAAREQDGGVEKLVASGFSEDQIGAVKLTNEEQEVLDKMRETFDSQFPEIQDTMRRVYNQPVEKVKNYFSFMTDWKAMDDSEVFERFGSQAPEQFGTPRKNVEAGFTKSRVGGDQKIKINAMDVFLQHTDNTSYLLELGETSKMLGEVAASPKYAELVGEQGQLLVREWIDVVARKGGAAGASQIPILDTLRRNVGAGILGLKLSTIMIQPTSLLDGMGFIGAKYGTKGLTNFLTDSEWRKFVINMPEIKDRLGGEFALRELTDDNWLQEIQRKGFIPLQILDQMTAGAIAGGAYERKMVELGLPIDIKEVNKEALAYAQLAVRRTQSSGSFKDVPLAVSRGALTGNRSLDRAVLQFQNFLLTRWSRIRHDAIRASINTKDPMKAANILFYITLAGLAGAGMRLGVNKVQDFITGREDQDTVTEDLAKNMVFEMTGNVPFLGTAMSMALYDGEFFPILDAPKGVIEGLNRAITSKTEGAKLRGLTQFVGSTGTLFGIPGSTQTEQLVRGALQDKKAEPKAKKPNIPGLPALPTLKKSLPTLPGLPAL